MPQLTRNFFVSLQLCVNFVQCFLVLNSIFTQITRIYSKQRLRCISYVDEYSPTLHYVEGPRNGIADTFSRLSCKDDAPGLVGKEATVSDSAYAYYSFFDDKAILIVFWVYRVYVILIYQKICWKIIL